MCGLKPKTNNLNNNKMRNQVLNVFGDQGVSTSSLVYVVAQPGNGVRTGGLRRDFSTTKVRLMFV